MGEGEDHPAGALDQAWGTTLAPRIGAISAYGDHGLASGNPLISA
jgi:hypothetical protein